MRRLPFLALVFLLLVVTTFPAKISAYPDEELVSKRADKPKIDPILLERQALFQQMEAIFGIPWTYLAAIDQYERSMKKRVKKTKSDEGRITAITIPPRRWSGELNPVEDDTNLASIRFFGGIGVDGSGDGIADQTNDRDVIVAMINYIKAYGFAPEDIYIALWNYYQRDSAIRTIQFFTKIYSKYQRLDLLEHSFPIPRRYHYGYNDTWGDARGWGGRRIHEGTDIFAGYGTPVLSTGYGVVEILGWNRYGGWRIGIRDIENVYHYFAHLSSFRKGLKVGDIVEPGQVIGYVGSSGYGKPGTSGKFAPHLHYGMYSETGLEEWAFNPYYYLKRWERQRRK